MPNVVNAEPTAYADLWRSYLRSRAHYWDDAVHPFGKRRVPEGLTWTNIVPTLPSAEALAAAAHPAPAKRCAAHGLHLRPQTHRAALRMHWLHIPKTGTSFGTTLMHRGCPRIPPDAAADDGAPIVTLTEQYPRRDRRWCDRGAFLGNLIC